MSIIYPVPESHQYLHDSSTSIKDLITHKDSICIPLVVDTEYTGHHRLGLTVQVKGVNHTPPKIYDHLDLQNYAAVNGCELRHKPINHMFAPLSYLETLGHDVELIIKDKVRKTELYGRKLPYCQFDIYAHFALAELLVIFTGDARQKVIEQLIYGKQRVIDMTRRLRTYTKSKKGFEVSDAIELPMHITIDGRLYRLKLRIIDSCALHGIASYKDLASATGVELKYKETLSQKDLENMLDTYFDKPVDFDNYALGDLEVYNILERNSELFKRVYKSLDIEDYFIEPKLTIGSTVRDFFKGVLYKAVGIAPDDKAKQEKLSEFLSYGSSSTLKLETNTTKCLLAKVFGGRCRNNRPTDIGNEDNYADFLVRTEVQNVLKNVIRQKNTLGKLTKIIVDNDIAGAYGNGLRNQIYPIGKPVIEDHQVSKFNEYTTLRKWLKQRKYGKDDCELVDGLWTAIVSTKEIDPDNHQWGTLRYSQDFLISWFDFRFTEVANMDTDTDKIDLEIQPKTGNIKILNNQVVQGVITSDFLEWLYNVCSPRQRNELLDNLYINTACYYPSYSRLDSFDDLLEIWEYWEGRNTTTSKKIKVRNRTQTLSSGAVYTVTQEPTFWLGLDLGKLIVDDLLAWRAMHKKLDGKKSPMDVLFKLCTNTLYGIFCSPYFDISNTVVGNNITARCRAMAWYMEKGHYAYQTITDGGQINPNSVCYPVSENRKVTAIGVTNLYRTNDPTKNNVTLKPLDNCESILPYSQDDTSKLRVTKNGIETIIDQPKEWLQEKLFKHLQDIFPNVSVLHRKTTKLEIEISPENTPIKRYSEQIGMFAFEIKDIYTKARFHGTSNYLLANQTDTKIAMRSYENKRHHQSFTITETKDILETEFYDGLPPSKFFLQQLDNPNYVIRSKTFKKTGILKLNDWKHNHDKWLDKGFVCGDTIEKTGILREFSLSQFTYQTIEQYLAIEKEVQRNKRRYNQSYEGYFINPDGTLNYELMIKTIDQIVATGALSINQELDLDRHRTRNIDISHPETQVYKAVKLQANRGVNVHYESEDESQSEPGLPIIFDGDLSNLDL